MRTPPLPRTGREDHPHIAESMSSSSNPSRGNASSSKVDLDVLIPFLQKDELHVSSPDMHSPHLRPSVSGDKAPVKTHMREDTFGIWSLLGLAWNAINVFGGLSFIFVIGFSAGGLPTIFYGFVGASFCSICITAVFAECAALFPTAGGAYHFSTFLTPEKYRRAVAYPCGWFNYLSWVLVYAALASILAALTYSLVNLCEPDFTVTHRWQLFVLYIGWATVALFVNVFALRAIPILEVLGAWATFLAFVGYSIALLVMAPKADAKFVFVTVNNLTGYSSSSMAVVIGLLNALASLGALDSPCHLAEELQSPTKIIPFALYIVIGSQVLVGIMWILVIGFCITDFETIINTTTGVPILELVRLGTRSTPAAIIFNVALLLNSIASILAVTTTASRQGFAFARDGGMFFQNWITAISPRWRVPINALLLQYGFVILLGLVYLFSTQGFNALVGSSVVFFCLSYGMPAIVMLTTRRFEIHQNDRTRYNLRKFAYPICIVVVIYTVLAVIFVMIPGQVPITATNMNYTIVIVAGFFILMAVAWFADAKKSFRPPSDNLIARVVLMETTLSKAPGVITSERLDS